MPPDVRVALTKAKEGLFFLWPVFTHKLPFCVTVKQKAECQSDPSTSDVITKKTWEPWHPQLMVSHL